MNEIEALIYANIAIWLGLGIYIVIIITKQLNLIKKVKKILNENEEI